MSSKKKRNAAHEAAISSSRNLDGRRLRTVNEAKALAEYLAVKPDMDKQEKEERKKRWEAVVEAAEQREADIKAGRGGRSNGDGKWLEEKEDVEDRVRASIKQAMANGLLAGNAAGLTRTESDESVDGSQGGSSDELDAADADGGQQVSAPDIKGKGNGKLPPISRKVYGWDDDDEDEDEDEEDEDEEMQGSSS